MEEERVKAAGLKPVTEETIRKAEARLQKYKQGKQMLDNRIVSNEQWWKMRHWDEMRKENKGEPEPASAWLFNSIINKHADFMDNYPEANILPREETDKETAQILSDIVPYILEQNGYEETYSEQTWDKLKTGTGVQGVFWNPEKLNGLGDVEIKTCDLLRLYWEPGVEKLQDSKEIFYLEAVDSDALKRQYPALEQKTTGGLLDIKEYITEDYIDNSEKTLVVDWYYKKRYKTLPKNEFEIPKVRTVLHYCKFAEGIILYSSENEGEDSWYSHGQYPFVLDTMFPEKGSPAAFGYLDAMKDCQAYIDRMGQAILKNTLAGSRPRYFCKMAAGINEEEFQDLSKDIVHYEGQPDDLKPIEVFPLNGTYYQVYQGKIEELKETSGNRDFSQGSTASGVTAASAIAALQEAGSKLSRDMIKSSFRAYKDVVFQVIELIRQFYDVPRAFRITNKLGQMEFLSFDNSLLKGEPETDNFGIMIGGRMPYFDISIAPQKASPFVKVSQNELAKEMYNLGFFNPQFSDQALACLDMMMFDGKEEVIQKIERNGTLYQQVIRMQATIQKMAALIAQTTGDTRLLDATAEQNLSQPVVKASGASRDMKTDSVGGVREELNATAGKARQRAAAASTPKS